MQTVSLIGLVKMELPDGDVRLCDGGLITFGGELYRDVDPVFGAIGSIDAISEGIGDEVPALQMTLLPPGTSSAGDLQQTGMQRSRIRFWVGVYVVDTGLISGTPDLVFDGQLDQCSLEIDPDERRLAVSVVSTAERLFERNIGNGLSPVFHKELWPGELGHDNATGIGVPVAWGAASPGAPGITAPAYSPKANNKYSVGY